MQLLVDGNGYINQLIDRNARVCKQQKWLASKIKPLEPKLADAKKERAYAKKT